VTIKIKKGNKHLEAHAAARPARKKDAKKLLSAAPRKPSIIKRVQAIIAPPSEPTSLYWAYGSNLHVERMVARCRNAEPLSKLYLAGRLVFRGVADVIGPEREGELIAGGLWRITPECEEALDQYEGVNRYVPARGMYVKKYLTLRVNGEVQKCLYYQMTSNGVMPPGEGYLNIIRQGYRDFGLNRDLLEEAVAYAYTRKDKGPQERSRYARMIAAGDKFATALGGVEGGNGR